MMTAGAVTIPDGGNPGRMTAAGTAGLMIPQTADQTVRVTMAWIREAEQIPAGETRTEPHLMTAAPVEIPGPAIHRRIQKVLRRPAGDQQKRLSSGG